MLLYSVGGVQLLLDRRKKIQGYMYVDPIEGTSEEAGEPYVCRVHGSVCDYDAQDVFESHC